MTSSEGVLISPAELAELLAAALPSVVADVRWTVGGPPGKPEFEAGHIPGAVWVDLETQLARPPGVGGRHPLPMVDSLVIAYDAATSQAASRLWWLLTDAGHRDVRVLDGGLAAWRAAGLPTVSGQAKPPQRGNFVAHLGQRPQLDAAEISARLGMRDAPTLVDVRAAERYSAEHEPIDPVAGHIPGAINLPATANLRADGRLLPPEQIAKLFAEAGGGEGAVLYCGSGITAAHSLLALESAGLTAAIYPGSWSDWIDDPSRPVATGPDP